MTFKQHRSFRGRITLDGVPLEQVDAFTYLVITLVNKMSWRHHLDTMAFKHHQLAGSLNNEFKTSLTKPISPVLQIYNVKVVSSVLYGAEIWGFEKPSQLAAAENRFLCMITSLPQSTPVLPMPSDLGRKALVDTAKLRPILYWRRIWCTPEMATFADGLRDVIGVDHFHKISWLRDIKGVLVSMGLPSLWKFPSRT